MDFLRWRPLGREDHLSLPDSSASQAGCTTMSVQQVMHTACIEHPAGGCRTDR